MNSDSLTPSTSSVLPLNDLNKLPNLVYNNRWSTEASEKVVTDVLQFLDAPKVGNIYVEEKRSVALFGRLLSSFNRVKLLPEQTEQVQALAKTMINNVKAENETLADLSLLGHNLYNIDTTTYQQLLAAIVQGHTAKMEEYIKIPFVRGFLPLLKQVKQNQATTDISAWLTRIFALSFEQVLTHYHPIELNRILWELLQIDEAGLTNWLNSVGEEKWLAKVDQIDNKDTLFRLCFVLNHLNTDLCEKIAKSIYNKFYSRGGKTHVADVPLLSFLMCHYNVRFRAFVPNPHFLASYIATKHYTLSHIAYSIFFIRKVYKKSLFVFREHLSKYAFYNNPGYNWQHLVDNYPIASSKEHLLNLVDRFNLTNEPGFTFKQIEKQLLYSDLTLSELTFDAAVAAFYDEENPKSVFKNKDFAEAYLRLYFDNMGWEVK